MTDVARNVTAAMQVLTPQASAGAAKVVSKQQLDISPSSQAERFIANVTSSTKLSPTSKRDLIDVVARIDQQLTNSGVQNHNFIDVAGLSVLLEQSASEGFPKYILMTGLRFYAAVGQTFPADPVPQEQVVQDISAKLNQISQAELGVSIDEVRAIIQQDSEVLRQAIEKVGQKVDVDGFAASDTGNGAPTTVTFA